MKKLAPLMTLTFAVLFLAGCAGSKGGAEAGAEAMALETENHKIRQEIFESKNKLGIPTDTGDEEK